MVVEPMTAVAIKQSVRPVVAQQLVYSFFVEPIDKLLVFLQAYPFDGRHPKRSVHVVLRSNPMYGHSVCYYTKYLHSAKHPIEVHRRLEIYTIDMCNNRNVE